MKEKNANNRYNCGFCGGKYNEKNAHYRDCDNCILAKIYIRMITKG